MRVPYIDLKAQYSSLRDEVLAALDRTCQRAAFILGEEVVEFEKEFAAFCGTKFCVALNSGTSALHLALLGCGVGRGDEVITSPNSFISTAEAVAYVGATPVFVDIDPKTANLDPKLIEDAVTPRTKAILPVHLYGRPADMDPILEIAIKRNLKVIEDACQAHGASYRGRRAGSLGHAAAFSFYPTKNLGAFGEGGAVTTDDEQIATLARSLRDHGQVCHYMHDQVGYNYRMPGLQGAVLRIKLRQLEKWNARRREIAKTYRELLRGAKLKMPFDDPRDEVVYHIFVVYVDNRDDFRAALAAKGVETAIHYPVPLHLQKALASLGYSSGDFPNAELACQRALCLPIFPELTNEQVGYVAKTLATVLGRV